MPKLFMHWLLALALIAACKSSQPAPDKSSTTSGTAAQNPAETVATPLDIDHNLGFEADSLAPWKAKGKAYQGAIDSQEAHAGRQSVRLARTGDDSNFGTLVGTIPVDQVRGHRLRLTGQVKTRDAASASLWMRVDGPDGILEFENLASKRLSGTTDWTTQVITLRVPDEAVKLVFGGILEGPGTVWFDSMELALLSDKKPTGPITIDGVVHSATGEPVAGAHVAVNQPWGDLPTAQAHSDKDGRFQVEVPSGSYALSATAPGYTAMFTEVLRFDGTEDTEPTILRMGTGGFTVRGTLRTPDGKSAGEMTVRIQRNSDSLGDTLYTRSDAQGRFEVTLADTARGLVFNLTDPSVFTEWRAITDAQDQTLDLVVHSRHPADPAVVEWIAGHAVPLTAVEAGNGFADLKPLRGMVGDARIVALGEATHGTREFFQLRHRMLEYLVEEHGFTVFAIEANFTESLAIDDYVVDGKGSAKEALAGIYFWTWNTEEVLALIEWMRQYNADPDHQKKLRFYGFDSQFAGVAADRVSEYVARLEPDRAKALRAALEPIANKEATGSYSKRPAAEKQAVRDAIADALGFLDRERRRLIDGSSENEFAIARRNLVVIQQVETTLADPVRGFEHRDLAMASNLEWILEHEAPGTRVVAWAHNGHVQRGPLFGKKTMGFHLARSLGPRYRAFGFSFNQGSFQAIRRSSDGKRAKLEEITVGPAPAGNIGATLARAGIPLFALDVRERAGKVPDKDHPALGWLESPHMMRNPGALFFSDEGSMAPQNLAELFDAMLFVDTTTRARPVAKK